MDDGRSQFIENNQSSFSDFLCDRQFLEDLLQNLHKALLFLAGRNTYVEGFGFGEVNRLVNGAARKAQKMLSFCKEKVL